MSEQISNNKRIAKNSIYLYLRMCISMIIGLYTSRVILSALGAEDYGINNIVGGFVSMLSLFTCSLSGATGRFITYELGVGNKDRLKDTFSTIMTLIIILSAIVLVLGETIGLWFVKEYLIIPEERWDMALFCYHCSILSFIVNLLALPYQSTVTAHEHFNFFAIVDICQSVFKLVIVWLICISPFDRLGTYATILLFVGIIVRVVYSFYCSKHFEETKFKLKVNKEIFKDIARYSAWITIGASSAIFKEQGVNVLINIFFGVLLNAARGIAMQVHAVVSQFSNSIAQAIQPQITKSYAAGQLRRSINLTFVLAKAKGFMIQVVALPLLIETQYVLNLWLGKTPDQTILFVQWAIVTCYARAIEDTHGPLYLATGNVRNLQIVGGGMMLLNLPLSFIFLKLGYPAIVTMQIGVTIEMIVMFIAFCFLKKMVNFPLFRFYKRVIIPQILIAVVACIPSIIINSYFMEESFGRLLINTIMIIILLSALTFVVIFNNNEKELVISTINNKLFKR